MLNSNNKTVEQDELLKKFYEEFDDEEVDFVERARINPDNRCGRCGHSMKRYYKKKNGEIATNREMKLFSRAERKRRLCS